MNLTLKDRKSNSFVPINGEQSIQFIVCASNINDVFIGKQLLNPTGMTIIHGTNNKDVVVYNPNKPEQAVQINPSSFEFESINPNDIRLVKFNRKVKIPAHTTLRLQHVLSVVEQLTEQEIEQYKALGCSPYLSVETEIQPNVYLGEAIYSVNQIQNNFPAEITNNSWRSH